MVPITEFKLVVVVLEASQPVKHVVEHVQIETHNFL
jgi:hypothetical protein